MLGQVRSSRESSSMQLGAEAINPIDYFATGAGAKMITIPQLTAHALGSFLARETQDLFGSSPSGLPELLPFAARLTLECIGNSDALYHNIEHTMLVTLVGHDILVGRALQRTTTVSDYANFILACLTHDIGYVRGVVQDDEDDAYVADISGRKIRLPVGSSDAALAPYHVDRSKLFVIERFDAVEDVDAARISRAIEYTRFPYADTPKEEVDDLNLPNNERRMIAGSSGTVPAEKSEAFDEAVMKFFEKH
jgi:hypothetical protein